ncbi:hypothetical protein [Lachnoclostridium sp.]|uniref:hypothetical protein n=1 Tax=Lachnoclostridium sp. TaxID=2028282 RepID=UPI0028A0F4ED|nr:hypothetical protein [Lachnoclostridium sp.]
MIILLLSGARFTPTQVVKSSSWIDKSSVLLGTVNSSPYKVFVYENTDKYHNILVKYKFPFWRSDSSSWANKTNDKVKLVGWCSYSEGSNGITVVPVQSFDDNVAYIKMGSGADLQQKMVKTGEVLLFYWTKSIRWNDLNAIAYSSDNKELYKLGYEIVNSTIHPDELRWLPSK